MTYFLKGYRFSRLFLNANVQFDLLWNNSGNCELIDRAKFLSSDKKGMRQYHLPKKTVKYTMEKNEWQKVLQRKVAKRMLNNLV